MMLKKIYNQDKLIRNTKLADGSLADVNKEENVVLKVLDNAVIGVELKRHSKAVHHISPKFLYIGLEEGWLAIQDNILTLKLLNEENVEYFIIRKPGYYCCFCNEAIESADSRVQDNKTFGMLHVEKEHINISDFAVDINNPAGYRKENFFTLVKKEGGVVDIEKAKECEKVYKRERNERFIKKLKDIN